MFTLTVAGRIYSTGNTYAEVTALARIMQVEYPTMHCAITPWYVGAQE